MYELYLIGDEWQIHTKEHGARAGDFISIMRFCMRVVGIDAIELDVAVSEMCKSNHNCAHFGIWKSFIYTYNRGEKKRTG
jgi:hypothetical protein